MESVMKCFTVTLLLLASLSLCKADCPTKLSDTTLYITDPENCQDYWICNSTIQEKRKCPLNHCFDTSVSECIYKDNLDCDTDGALFPDCNNCTRYWQCSNGKKTHMICPNYPKLWFNFQKNECDYIRNYPVLHGCGDSQCTEGPDHRQYPVDNDKRKFVWCLSGKAYLYACCEDNEECHFDVKQQLCDFKPMTGKKNFIKKYRYMNINDDLKANISVCGKSPLVPTTY